MNALESCYPVGAFKCARHSERVHRYQHDEEFIKGESISVPHGVNVK
jgi:hypothetical protein